MKVQVLNALATVRADIGHNAVAALVDAQLFAQLRNDRVDVAQQRGVILGQADAMCCFGMTRKCTGACGSMS